MKKFLKKIWIFLIGKVHITLTPPSVNKKVKSFQIRRIYPILLMIIITGTIIGLSFQYHQYHSRFIAADSERQELKGVKAENENLKKELVSLSNDTEELRQALSNLQKYNDEIRDTIDISEDGEEKQDSPEMEFRTLFSYNSSIFQQGTPMGGGEFRLDYQESDELIKSMQQNINKIDEEIPSQREELDELKEETEEHNARQAATPSIWPLADEGQGYVASNFGWRNDPHSSEREHHDGMDIAVWYNTPVLAAANGKISFAGWKDGYGWTIVIEHGFGYETYYAHLNRIQVKKGEEVSRGEVIGLSGNSGRSTGPHLHYEVRVNNVPEDPREYIRR
ncbi:MAG: peptidoglycan DD-metalloendopeptidase family protein [Bacillota bacterium]